MACLALEQGALGRGDRGGGGSVSAGGRSTLGSAAAEDVELRAQGTPASASRSVIRAASASRLASASGLCTK